MKFSFKEDAKKILVILFSSVVTALCIKSFVRTGGLIPGGVTGLTVMIQRIAEQFFGVSVPYTLINLLLNAIPLVLGFVLVGKKMAVYSAISVVLTSVLVDLIPAIPITSDILLISVFGGIISGFAGGLCLRMSTTMGGTDLIAMVISERSGMDSFNLMLGFNAVLLCAAGLLFGWDKALYSIVYQFAATEIVHVLYRAYQQQTLFIVTNVPQEVCDAIGETSNHTATVLNGLGSHENRERSIVYSVVSGSEYKNVISAVRRADPEAFVNAIRTERVSGRFYRRPVE